MELTDAEIETLAYTLLGEARGEGPVGMYMVANVIRNRAESPLYPDNPAEVATQPWQFSTNNGPNMGGGNQEQTRRDAPKGSQQYQTAETIARRVFEADQQVDVTGGSLFYHARGIRPSWSNSVVSSYGTLRQGGHVFYPRSQPSADIEGEVWQAIAAPRAAIVRPIGVSAADISEYYTPTIDQVLNFDDLGNKTAIQFFSFGRIADRDFYGITDRGVASLVRDGRTTARQRIEQARVEQLGERRRQAAQQAVLNTNTAALTERPDPDLTKSEIIVRKLANAHPVGPQRRASARPDPELGDRPVAQQLRENFMVGPNGRIVPRETQVGAGTAQAISSAVFGKPKTSAPVAKDRAQREAIARVPASTAKTSAPVAADPAVRAAIASTAGLSTRTGRVTAEGLAVRVVPLIAIDDRGQPIIVPQAKPVVRTIPAGPTRSRGEAAAAARRVAQVKREVRANPVDRMIQPDLGYMRADTPANREAALKAKPTGPTRGRGAAGAAARSSAQRLPQSPANLPAPTGVDANVFRYTGGVTPDRIIERYTKPVISTQVVKQQVGRAIKPSIVSPVVPARRPTEITMPKSPTVPARFLEQVERIDAMPRPAAGAPKGAPFNVKTLVDGINAEAARVGVPTKKSAPTVTKELAPVPLTRPPGLGSSKGLVGGQEEAAPGLSPQQRMEQIGKPGKVSTQTVNPPKRRPETPETKELQAPAVPARRPETAAARPQTVSRSAPIAITVTGGRRMEGARNAYVASNGYIYSTNGPGGRPTQVGRVNTGETPSQMYERLSAPASYHPHTGSTWYSPTDSWNIPQSIV